MTPRSRRGQAARASHLFLSSVALLLLAAPLARAAVANDFSLYPSAAQPCLQEADAQSNCQGDTVEEVNDCLCSDRTSFVTHAARCIGPQAPDTLRAVYNAMNINCDDSGTPLSLDEEAFLQIAAEASSATAASLPSIPTDISTSSSSPSSPNALSASTTPPTFSSTTSSTTLPSQANSSTSPVARDDLAERQKDDDENPPLSTAVIVGISVGGTAGVALLLATFIIIWKKVRRSHSPYDEARPMLDNPGGAGGRAATWNTSPGIGSDGGKSGEFAHPGSTAPPQDWKAADGKPGWRPASQSPALGSMFAGVWSPQDRGRDTQHASQQQQQHGTWGYHPGQPWGGSIGGRPRQQPPNQSLGPVAEFSPSDSQPEVGGTDHDKKVYELAAMPVAAQLPKKPVEMPGSLGHATQAQAKSRSNSPWATSPRR